MPATTRPSHLPFIRETIAQLVAHQVRWGGRPDGPACLTVAQPTGVSYLSLGHRTDDGFKTYWFPAQPHEAEPFRLDLDLWPTLDALTDLTGDAQYRALVDGMAGGFAEGGFNPRCGLGYLGQECDFNVHTLEPVGSGTNSDPKFKPRNDGLCQSLPLERLWRHAPNQTARMFRAMFYGLITDADRMDYNRFCYYRFDDHKRRASLPPDSAHCAFDSTAGRMIHWWASCYRHTADPDCLDWVERLAAKWQAVQHPVSGLMPDFFGAKPSNDPVQHPGQWAESRGAATTASAFVQASALLGTTGDKKHIAQRLKTMGVALARGVARFAWDPDKRRFRETLHLDGRPYETSARYAFSNEKEKAHWVAKDKKYENTAVFAGVGLYRHPPFWSEYAGSDIPLHLALVARLTGDPELRAFLEMLVEPIAQEAQAVSRPHTPEGRWTYHADAQYIRTLVQLAGLTANPALLNHADKLAALTIASLEQTELLWWQTSNRGVLLEALTRLELAQNGNLELAAV